MPKLKVLFFTLAAITLCAAALWHGLRPPNDPVCNGVKLSEWIEKGNRDWSANRITPKDLRSLGPEAVEFIAYFIKKNLPGETNGLRGHLPDALRNYLPSSLNRRHSYGSLEQCLYAIEQLSNFGPEARPAIPLLVKILDHPSNGLRNAAAGCLNGIGPESWDEVENILASTKVEGKRAILFTLTNRLSNPAPTPSKVDLERILDLFLEACTDPDPEIQVLGVGGLLNCQGFYSYLFTDLNLPDRAGPVVARCLNRSEGLLKSVSARALYYYPESIGLAIHSLELMAKDPSIFYSDPARAALQRYEKSVQSKD